MHSSAVNHPCAVPGCGREYRQRRSLRNHLIARHADWLRSHHGDSIGPDEDITPAAAVVAAKTGPPKGNREEDILSTLTAPRHVAIDYRDAAGRRMNRREALIGSMQGNPLPHQRRYPTHQRQHADGGVATAAGNGGGQSDSNASAIAAVARLGGLGDVMNAMLPSAATLAHDPATMSYTAAVSAAGGNNGNGAHANNYDDIIRHNPMNDGAPTTNFIQCSSILAANGQPNMIYYSAGAAPPPPLQHLCNTGLSPDLASMAGTLGLGLSPNDPVSMAAFAAALQYLSSHDSRNEGSLQGATAAAMAAANAMNPAGAGGPVGLAAPGHANLMALNKAAMMIGQLPPVPTAIVGLPPNIADPASTFYSAGESSIEYSSTADDNIRESMVKHAGLSSGGGSDVHMGSNGNGMRCF